MSWQKEHGTDKIEFKVLQKGLLELVRVQSRWSSQKCEICRKLIDPAKDKCALRGRGNTHFHVRCMYNKIPEVQAKIKEVIKELMIDDL